MSRSRPSPWWTRGSAGCVYIDGRLVRELGAGTYGFWNAVTAPRVEVLELRRQTVEVSGQEILTRDKVTVRVNVSAVYEIVNVVTARSGVKDVNEHLYRTLQIAVRQTLGKRTLEEVLAEKAGHRRSRCRPRCAARWRSMVFA